MLTALCKSPRLARWLPLLTLLALDLVTKGLACRYLSHDQPVRDEALLQFVLRLNAGPGVWATEILAKRSGAALFSSAMGYAGAALYLFAIRHTTWSVLRKVLLGFAMFYASAALCAVVQHFVGHASRTTGELAAKFGTTAFAVCAWWLAQRTLLRVVTTLFAAAGLGNSLCLIAPPHAVVDFIYSRLLTRYARHGVMNLADLYFDAGLLGLIALTLRAMPSTIRRGVGRGA